MRHVRNYIKARQDRFASSRFFEQLDLDETSPEALSFVSGLTFFVMVFQDILRLNEARVRDPRLRAIARHHRREDSGHDEWFLHDLAEIEGRLPDVREVFSPGFTTTRDAAYALVAEALRSDDDRASIALLLVLESTGHVFFDRVVAYLERIGAGGDLWYFARGHLDVELGHELFEKQMNATLDRIELTDVERGAILAAVDRCFDPITEMLDALRTCAKSAPPQATVPPASTTQLRRAALPAFAPLRLPRVG